MKILIILVLFCIVSTISDQDCIESYLKKIWYSSKDEVVCKTFIQNFTADFKQDVMARLKAEDHQNCIVKAIDEYKIVDFFLKGFAEDLKSNFTEDEVYQEILEVYKKNYIEAAKFICLTDVQWKSIFDTEVSYFKHIAKEEKHSEKRCKQIYFIKNNFINPADFNIDVATFNATNCSHVFKEIERKFRVSEENLENIESVFIQSSQCYARKFKDEKIFLKMEAVKVFGSLELTEDQNKKLRVKYIENKISMATIVLKCARDQV